MKSMSVAILIIALMQSGLATGVSPRESFEMKLNRPFVRLQLVDYAVAPESLRFDAAKGSGLYSFAMPYAEDRRLKFVTARFDGGKFVTGEVHVFGFEARPIDRKAFDKLRDEFPMVSVRTDCKSIDGVAVLYPARKAKTTFVAKDDRTLDENPVSVRLGSLEQSLRYIAVSPDGLRYRVLLKGKDGHAIDLGVATAKQRISSASVLAAIRTDIERRDPKRKGQVSDRDVVDYRHGATISSVAEPI